MKTIHARLALVFGLLILITPINALGIRVGVKCTSSYCSGSWFAYIGLQPGGVITDTALIKSFEDTTKEILFYHRGAIYSSSCGFALAQYSTPLAGAATWMTVPEYIGPIGAKAQIEIPFTINVPEDASPGGYAAAFLIEEIKDGCDPTLGGICITTRNGTRVYLSVAGEAVPVGEGSSDMLELVDIDEDGDIDRFESSTLYRNDGGSFTKVTESYGGFTGKLYFADIDADGRSELFTVDWPCTIQYYENTGTPQEPVWNLANGAWISLGTDSIIGMTFHDVDGDGDLDLFLATGWGYVYYYENTGDQQAASWEKRSSDYVADRTDLTGPICAKRLAFVDIDADGVKELLLGEEYKIYAFKEISTLQGVEWAHQPDALAFLGVDINNRPTVADVDGDGLEELHVMSYFKRYTYEFPAPQQPGTGDVNGDQNIDLADVILSLRCLAGVSTTEIRNDYVDSDADINGDGRLTLSEPIGILRTLAEASGP